MNNIKTARINAGYSQKEISITLGVSIPTVSDWESGKKFPSGKNLVKLSQTLHTTIDYLLGCENQEKPIPTDGDGLSENARRFIPLVDGLTPAQQELLLSQLQAWNEQNRKQALAAQQSGEERGPKSDL